MSTQTRIGVRIDTAGITSRVDFTEDSLAALQAAVSGDIEAIMIGDELTMFANENGIAQFGVLTRNTAAERILATSGTGWVSPYVIGPVIFTGGVDDDGETLGLSEHDLRMIEAIAQGYREGFAVRAARLGAVSEN